MVNRADVERISALLAATGDAVVVLDSERRLVAASPAAAEALGDVTPGRRFGEDAEGAEPGPLVLFLDAVPELSAYQELRAGFTAAVSHELRTPLARMLVLLETATLPDADVDQLVDQARREVQNARELIDDVLFLGELETGREVVSLGRTVALPVAEEVVARIRSARRAGAGGSDPHRRRRDRAAAASTDAPRGAGEPRDERDPLRGPREAGARSRSCRSRPSRC